MKKMIGVLLLLCSIGSAVYGLVQTEPTAMEEVLSKGNCIITFVSSEIEKKPAEITADRQKQALPYYIIAAMSAVLGAVVLNSAKHQD